MPDRKAIHLNWTTEKPTKPGWYWVKNMWLNDPGVIRVFLDSDVLFAVISPTTNIPIEQLNSRIEWAGPIKEPT